MAKYYNPTTRQIIDVANPEMNPQLIAGTTLIPDQSITQVEREVTLPSGKTGLQDPLGNIYQRGTNPITGLSEKQTITGEFLTPSTSLNFQQPITSPIFPISSLDTLLPKLEATPQETQADTLSQQLQRLNEQILGQSTLRTEKEKEFGVEGLRKTQTDLSAQLKGLQAEALAVPIQISQEFTGRASVGEQNRVSQARLRENAIKALTVSSLLEANRGNLVLALDQVDRAVAQKYDPIREEIAVRQANLDLILRSPLTSFAEKRRAEEQKAKQEIRATQITQQEQEQQSIWKIAVEVASKGADSLTLRNIQSAPNSVEAARLAAPFLQEPKRNTFKTQMVGKNLVELEFNPQGQVVNQRQLVAGVTGAAAGGITLPKAKNGVDLNFTPSRALSVKENEKVQVVVQGLELINTAEELYNQAVGKEFVGPGAGILARLKQPFRAIGAFLGLNQAAQQYSDFLSSNKAPIAKGLKGEVGNLAEAEQKDALKTFPTFGNTPDVAQRKFEIARQQAVSKLQAMGKFDESFKEQTTQTIAEPQRFELDGVIYVEQPDGTYLPE